MRRSTLETVAFTTDHVAHIQNRDPDYARLTVKEEHERLCGSAGLPSSHYNFEHFRVALDFRQHYSPETEELIKHIEAEEGPIFAMKELLVCKNTISTKRPPPFSKVFFG